ncbi:hypothetical protein Taro_004811 [Colocasia esculenta]|uniref:Pentatricopeptide repeat-containing protein n=1 Tax=Colocasia esculenta TaxID=4460 RepID=A0A843TL99_COLES|nr:hypothetical protein [Colocasia esculenta]
MAASVAPPRALAFVAHHHTPPPHHCELNVHRRPASPFFPRWPRREPSAATGGSSTPLPTRNVLSTDDPELRRRGPPDSAAYATAVEACDCLRLGRQLHAHALKSGYGGSPEFLETKLVSMYGRCGSVETARYLFEKMSTRNMHTWVGILGACVDHGYFEKALLLFLRLLEEEIGLQFFVFSPIFRACSGLNLLALGRQLHGFVIKREFTSSIYVGNALIDMYGKCRSLDEAKMVLEKMPEADCVSWNSVVTACVSSGMVFEALEILESMRFSGNPSPNLVSWSAVVGGFAREGYDVEALDLLCQMMGYGIDPNAQTLASVLPACARLESLSRGKEIHGYIVRHQFMSNSFVINGLVDVYRRCGDMHSASKIFSRFSARNSVSINTMIVGYCEKGEVELARKLFDEMELRGVKRDSISWNSMISGYVGNRYFDKALELFRNMQFQEGISPDSFTLGSVISFCADTAALRQGQELHSFAITKGIILDVCVSGALVDMYCRCGDLVSARKVFEKISEKDVAIWNSLISGYARCNRLEQTQMLLSTMKADGFKPNIHTWNGILAGYVENKHYESALQMLGEMKTANLKPDLFTMGIIIPACSRLASIERGKQLHTNLIRSCWDADVHLGTALVGMYAKCGYIRNAEQAFYRISQHNLVAYNTMLAGYATHGLRKKVITLFRQLLSNRIRPDGITFLSVLSSCAHDGSIKQGFEYFTLMQKHDIKPELKHYSCMVDLLSRAGHLSESHKLIQKMPMEPDSIIWGALLRGCVAHRNHELGEVIAKKLVELEADAGNYIVLANLYASARMQDDYATTRQIIRDTKMHKTPGCSWIDDGNQVHVFLAGDIKHQQTIKIYETLDILSSHMKSE